MSVPASLEKIFFAFILENPKFFERTSEHYFMNDHVKYVFQIVKKYYLTQKNRIVPSPKKIVELVRLEDRSKERISNDILKQILETDVGQYQQTEEDDWLENTIKGWLIEGGVRDRIMQSITKLRELDPHTINYEQTLSTFHSIKDLIGDTSLISYTDDDLGSDFDDPEAHTQNTSLNKIPTGWPNVDNLLDGGWDRKTLNILMAPSGVGKSLWLCNIAVNAANAGKNVVYVSLEMGEKKIMKRLGSTRLKIPIYEYDELSKDTYFMKQKLAELQHGYSKGSDMFDNRVGKIFAKEYPAGTATIYDVDDYIKRLEEIKGIKFDMLIIDYLTIMNPNTTNGSLYQNGKALAEGIRAIAQKYNLVSLSAMQVAKDAFDANDISAKDISESKAILETSDTLFGIIRTPQMKKDGIFYLKLIKLRDGDFKWIRCRFTMEKQYLLLKEDSVID